MSVTDAMIKELRLSAHPEGGYYRRVYQSDTALTVAGNQQLPAATAIIYLLTGNDFSAFHRIQSDELWCLGRHNSAVRIIELREDWQETLLGPQNPVHCVPAGTWFAAQLVERTASHFAQVYCTVTPGFDFTRFELADSHSLSAEYPHRQQQIKPLCRTDG